MRPFGWILFTAIIVLTGAGYFLFTKIQKEAPTPPVTPPVVTENMTEKEIIPQQKTMTLTITSPVFEMNGTIPTRFTCDGKNISPELIFTGAPASTMSFALTMEDPDVPHSVRADGMWNHWVVWNIPPSTVRLEEGAVSPGILGSNTSGKAKYMGPCPPDREHGYIFTLYALDSLLSLPQGATKEELLQAISSHIIEQSQLIGRYNRSHN